MNKENQLIKHGELVGGIPTPLKNDGVKVSWDLMTFPTEWKVRKFHGSKPPIRYKGICVYTSWAGTAGMIWVSTRKLREKSSSESRLEAMHKRAIDQANECDFPMVSSKPLRNVAWIRSDWCRRDAKCDPTIHLIHPFMVWPSIPFGFVWKIIGSCQVLMLNNSMFIHFPTEIVQICYQKWYAHSPVNCINRVRNHYLSLYIYNYIYIIYICILIPWSPHNPCLVGRPMPSWSTMTVSCLLAVSAKRVHTCDGGTVSEEPVLFKWLLQ